MKRIAPLSALASLALCAALSAAAVSTAVAAPPQSGGVIDRNGVRLLNTARAVAFGEAQADVIAHASTVFGGAPVLTQQTNCRNGAFQTADWGKGLKLIFQDGKFVGWHADRALAPGYTNRARIEFGRTVAAMKEENGGLILADAVRGREFALDGVYGRVLQRGPDATVDELWGGTECRPR